MSKPLLITALICAALSISIVNNALHGGRTKGVFIQTRDKFRLVPVAIRNLKILSSRDKIELIIMANEFTYKIQSIIYTFNQAIPNMKKEDYKRKIEEIMLSTIDLVHKIQRCIYGDTAKLQKQLASALEDFAVLTDRCLQVVTRHHGDGESFISNQIRESTDMSIWSINKLYFQAVLFTKSNKELNKEIDSELAPLGSAFDKIKINDEETRDELIHLVQLSKQLTHNIVLKLEHWMALNPKDEESYKIVSEAAAIMSKVYDKQHTIITSNLSATKIITQYKEAYGSGSIKMKRMSDAVLRENLGGQEFVRSVILDCLTLANTFTAELELFVAKKNTHTFV